MKVLITGSSGLLGIELANHLSSEGIVVTTLGRRAVSSEFENYSWSLGMSPKPESFLEVDCLIHLAWSTTDRGPHDFHLNVGGSEKIIELSKILGTKVINISSLAAINPKSMYGKAKENVEKSNFEGINLRIAKIENQNDLKRRSFSQKLIRGLIIVPTPRHLNVQVIEMDKLLNEITKYVKGDLDRGIYTLPCETYNFRDYLKKYHNLKSFYVPKSALNYLFIILDRTGSRKGRLLYDRWLSLLSTDHALGQ
jgi:hypothetical protein